MSRASALASLKASASVSSLVPALGGGPTNKELILTGDGISEGVLPDTGNILRYYHFSAGSGSTLVDASGNGDDGSIVSANWVDGYGGFGGLDYQDGYVDIPDFPQLSNGYTIVTLTNFDSVNDGDSDDDIVIEQNNGILNQEEGGVYKFQHHDGGGFQPASAGVSNGVWNMWGSKWDTSLMTLYKNASKADTNSNITGINSFSNNDLLGAFSNGSQDFLDGKQSLVIVWDTNLSDGALETIAKDIGLG